MQEGNQPTQPKLFDTETGAPIALPADQIAQAVTAGKAGFVKGTQVAVINPEGKAVTIPAEDTPHAFQNGYSLETPDLQTERFNREEFGEGTGNEIKAGLAGAARGATLGLSDQALTHSGLVDPATLDSLKRYNPGSTLVGETAGIFGPSLMTGGAASLVPANAVAKAGAAVSEGVGKAIGADAAKGLAQKIVASVVPRAAGSMVEGAAFGAGNELSEASLGDRDLNAESLQANVGLGALIGGVVGVGALPIEHGLKAVLTKEGAHTASSDLIGKTEAIRSGGNPDGPTLEGLNSTPGFVADKMQKMLPPDSVEAIAKKVKEAPFQALSPELPQKQALESAIGQVPDLQFPVHRAQLESLENGTSRDIYKTALEAPNQVGEHLRNYEALQKQELTGKLENEIKSIAPNFKPSETIEQAGNRAIEAIRAPYEAEKTSLGPAFKEIDEVAGRTEAGNHDVLGVIREALPQLDRHIEVEGGKVKLAPFDAAMGITEHSYGTLKNVLKSLQDRAINVSDVRNIRDYVSAAISPTASSEEKAVLGKVKKSLMDYMQSRVEDAGVSVGVRDTFKRYAQNEERRELAEYVLGGKLKGEGGLKKAIVPEDVLKNLFSDSPTVEAIKGLVGPAKFQELAADWLSLQKQAMTKDGVFSSNKFGTFLAGKSPELTAAFGADAGKISRIKSMNDIMRILPDAKSVNPSGTAKTSEILKTISGLGGLIRHPHEIVGKFMEHLPEAIEQKANQARLNDLLKGRGTGENLAARSKERFITLKNIEAQSAEIAHRIGSAVQGFISQTKRAAAPLSVGYLGGTKLSDHKSERRKGDKFAMFQRRFDEVAQATSNPQALTEKIAQNTAHLALHAPEIAGSLTQTAVKATQFLYDKAPKDPLLGMTVLPHLKKYQPSDAQVSKWERYVTAVDHPMSVVHDLKNGTLTQEGVDTLKTVYPKIYQQVTASLMDGLSDLKEDLPYSKRLQLSTFFGLPVDHSIDPMFVHQMQAIHQANAQNQKKSGQGMTPARSDKLNLASNSMTDMEALATRA